MDFHNFFTPYVSVVEESISRCFSKLPLVEEFGFRVHGYADDLQIYDHVDYRQSSDVIVIFSLCVYAIKDWMARNRLRLNPSKTEIIWIGSARRVRGLSIDPVLIYGSWITPSKPELSTGRMHPRVGSGRVTILPDFGGSGRAGSAFRNCNVM